MHKEHADLGRNNRPNRIGQQQVLTYAISQLRKRSDERSQMLATSIQTELNQGVEDIPFPTELPLRRNKDGFDTKPWGKFIKGKLSILGENQTTLAQNIIVSPETVSSYVRGLRFPKNIDTHERIIGALYLNEEEQKEYYTLAHISFTTVLEYRKRNKNI